MNADTKILCGRIELLEMKVDKLLRMQQLYHRWQCGQLPNCASKPTVDNRYLMLTDDEKNELNDLVYGNK